MTRYLTAACLAASLSATTALSQEVIGTLTGTLDGAERTWFLTAENGMSQSSSSVIGTYMIVTLFGHASDDTLTEAEDALIVEFSVVDGAADFADLRYLAEGGYVAAYVGMDDAPAQITLTRQEVGADGLMVEGTVSAVLGWSDGVSDEVDATNTVTLEASFAATVPTEE